jgi:hypothetical protein
MNINDDTNKKISNKIADLGLDDVVINRLKYEQFRSATTFVKFVSNLDNPPYHKIRQGITLTQLIKKANAILSMKESGETDKKLKEEMKEK